SSRSPTARTHLRASPSSRAPSGARCGPPACESRARCRDRRVRRIGRATMDAYRAALDYLTGLEVSAGWDLKLERMRAAVERRGHPERAWPSVHIAGTNGKGSTAAMIEAILRAAGHRTGLY